MFVFKVSDYGYFSCSIFFGIWTEYRGSQDVAHIQFERVKIQNRKNSVFGHKPWKINYASSCTFSMILCFLHFLWFIHFISLIHSWKGGEGGGEFFEIFIKRGFRYFSWKGMGWWNRGEGGVLKKRVSLIIILSNPFQCFLSLGVCCVCVLFIYATSTSIICVWQEELSFIASNQQIYDLHKWVIFEKKKHFRK